MVPAGSTGEAPRGRSDRGGASQDAAARPVKAYCGMRRRSTSPAASSTDPPWCFSTNPPRGSIPGVRGGMWSAIRALADRGSTVQLITQYVMAVTRLAGAALSRPMPRVMLPALDMLQSVTSGPRPRSKPSRKLIRATLRPAGSNVSGSGDRCRAGFETLCSKTNRATTNSWSVSVETALEGGHVPVVVEQPGNSA